MIGEWIDGDGASELNMNELGETGNTVCLQYKEFVVPQ
jgi:hypothetical protein